MRAEEITNGRVDPQALCLCEPTMFTASDGEQYVGNPDLVERLVKAGGVGVGNDRVSIAVYSQNRRKSWPHICQRRHTFRNLFPIGPAPEPRFCEVP